MSTTLPQIADEPRTRRWVRLADGAAMVASALCLVHCLVLPALLLALPLLAAVVTIPETFHPIAFLVALPFSAFALRSGHWRHRRRAPGFLALVGLTLLGVAAFAIEHEAVERAMSSLGAILLATGHVANWRAMTHRGVSCTLGDAA